MGVSGKIHLLGQKQLGPTGPLFVGFGSFLGKLEGRQKWQKLILRISTHRQYLEIWFSYKFCSCWFCPVLYPCESRLLCCSEVQIVPRRTCDGSHELDENSYRKLFYLALKKCLRFYSFTNPVKGCERWFCRPCIQNMCGDVQYSMTCNPQLQLIITWNPTWVNIISP